MPKPEDIPSLSLSSEEVLLLPPDVAIIQDPSDPEDKTLKISYRYYDDKLCQIKDLNNACNRKFVKDLRTIGKSNSDNLALNNIGTTRVYNDNEYKKLFNHLTLDVTYIKEHSLAGTARIFYFVLGNHFNIVAITNSHFNY